MDARLEVAVAGEHRADDEVALGDRRRDLVGERARVADARRAAVADGVEAERVEVLLQPGLLVVVGHDLRARRERRLHPRLALQAALERVPREQAGGDHHLRVRRVRARRDRRDHDRAVVELVVGAADRRAVVLGRARRSRPGRCRGAASPPGCCSVRRIGRGERVGDRVVVRAVRVVDAERAERLDERVLRVASGTRSCGRRGPAIDGSTSPRSSSTTCEYVACSDGSCQSRFSLQYASTSAIRSARRPVRRR